MCCNARDNRAPLARVKVPGADTCHFADTRTTGRGCSKRRATGSSAYSPGLLCMRLLPALQVGKYRVDLPRFEAYALPTLERIQGGSVCIVDEIGKMELFSEVSVRHRAFTSRGC